MKVMPNPFYQEAIIQYHLAKESEVAIQILDINGKIVQQLGNNSIQSRGLHEIRLSNHQMQSGMYYIFLITPEAMISQKVILIK